MLDGTQRYYVLGGKGGVGRTSMAASLAVKFANHGEPTLIVSTDLTRSLCASFEQVSLNACVVYMLLELSFLVSMLSVLLMLFIGLGR